MATFSSICSPNFLQIPKPFTTKQPLQPSKLLVNILHSNPSLISHKFAVSSPLKTKRLSVVAQETAVVTKSSDAERRLYVGNIPRNLKNDELQKIVQEHGAVEKVEVMYDKYSGRSRRFGFVTMKTIEDANAAIEKLNGTEIGGRVIKVNVTEKPLSIPDFSLLQAEETQFVDSPYKVYVGNLAKEVTSDILKEFFSEKANAVSAKVSRVPGTSKSSGYGFVSFSSEEDVETAVSSLNNVLLEGQKIRVNKA